MRTARRRRRASEKFSFLKLALLCGFLLLLAVVSFGSVAAGYIYFKFSDDLPDVAVLKNYQPSIITRIYSDKDELIGEFDVEKRVLVPLEKIPLKLKQATLAVEDANFYSHWGIDPKAIFRAFFANLQAGHVVEGASTITQQLSKTFFLSREKSIERKIREAILAVRLEALFGKDEILEMYLNHIYYGHGTYGVEAAAQTYFGKHVQDLTLEQCATIVGLPKAPNHYSPYRNPEQARQRRNHVIRRMAALDFIDEKEADRALKSDIKLGGSLDRLNEAPYFVEYIRQFLEDKYGSSKMYHDGLEVYTTLNLKDQVIAQKAVRENLRVADKRYGYRGPVAKVDPGWSHAAMQKYARDLNEFKNGEGVQEGKIVRGIVADVGPDQVRVLFGNGEGIIDIDNMSWARPPNLKVDGAWARIRSPGEALSVGDIILAKPLSASPSGIWSLALEQEPEVEAGLLSLDRGGNIKAMVGGYDFSRSQFNRALQAVRQPGSAFKPVIYATAISQGFTPASIIIDSPIIFKDKEDYFDDRWKPENFEEKFYGPTSLRTALTHSRNVVTIKLLQNIGVKKAIQLARKLGISSPLSENLSIALGSSGVTLYELTTAFSVFANNGKLISPMPVRYIKDRNKEVIYTAQPKIVDVLPGGVAYVITNMLESVVQDGTAVKVKALKRPVAGKTGTTNNYVDAWFVGFTPELMTGVWVGKDKDESLGINETGARAAIPIWLDYMKDALEGEPVKDFEAPEDVTFLRINPETGRASGFDDPASKFEAFLGSNLPEKSAGSPAPAVENTF
ncbi:MAG: PBP1A family penicillin-binding protein [Nitrospinae bacterium]|nr:PBP1A family penicillin-binding protein [Nitrospinota bacterium]